ncbi:hypothetical protein [Parerythrobacter aestuarii]|uniref:hypothetical protein n=1 Tax=Parerythrobacter aestuarii TaxID=3020909 RepID=UPI0024DEA035|nr:hypothetical protein [Parerythrobacter aestuarii]
MEFLGQLAFASDAELLALYGVGFLLLALLAMVAERRRMKRARIDKVGWVPWTGVFLLCAIIGGGLLALAVPGMLRG